MLFEKKTWVNNVTQANASNFNDLEQRIYDAVIDFSDVLVNNPALNQASALQQALNDAAGQTLILPPWNILVNTTINVPDNTRIIGYGAKIFNLTTHIPLLSVGSNVCIWGLELEGAGNAAINASGTGITFAGASSAAYKNGLLLEDVYIHDLGYHAVDLQFVENCILRNCRIESVGHAGVMGLSVNGVTVTQSTIKDVLYRTSDSTAYGVAFTRDATTNSLTTYPRSFNCEVSGCLIENIPDWEALDTHAGENIRFLYNTIQNCKWPINVGPSGVGGTYDWGPQACKIIGNEIHGTNQGAGVVLGGAPTGVNGTYNDLARGCIVRDNQFYQCGVANSDTYGAIHMHGTYGARIADNYIYRPQSNGIVCWHDNYSFGLTGNVIVDPHDTVLTIPSGISFRSTFQNGRVAQNEILRENGALDTFVCVNGLVAWTTTSTAISFGPNRNTALTPYSGFHSAVFEFPLLNNAKFVASTGSPESVVTAPPGSLYCNRNGGAGTTLYIKESGTGNTGWRAV